MSSRSWYVGILTVFFILIASVAAAPESVGGWPADSILLEDLVFVTEDAGDPSTARGCEAISVFDAATGEAYYLGTTHVSPGRLATSQDMTLALAPFSNTAAFLDGRQFPFIYSLLQDRSSSNTWMDGIIVGNSPLDVTGSGAPDIATGGAAALTVGGRSMLISVSTKAPSPPGAYFYDNRKPYYLRKYPAPAAFGGVRRLGRVEGSMTLDGVAVRIFTTRDGQLAHVVTDHHTVHTVDIDKMAEIAPVINLASFIAPKDEHNDIPLGYMHATMSADERFLVLNRGQSNELSVVDLSKRSSRTVSTSVDVDWIGGVALNRAWLNPSVLAIHAGDRIITYRFAGDGALIELGRAVIPSPYVTARLRGVMEYIGPLYSIAWSGSGGRIIAATEKSMADFVVVDVDYEGVALKPVRYLSACQLVGLAPNDIVTANGLLTPPWTPTTPATASPTSTGTPPPTLTPTETATPSPSATSFPTPTSSATATPMPVPLILPLLLREACTPGTQRVDVALVLDASSSMTEPSSAGRAKIDAARDAARAFLDRLRLDAGDQAAVVTFNDDAWLRIPLTADRAALDQTLNGIATAQHTRIDRGIAVARDELLGPRHRPANTPVMLVLTDGIANPVPVDVAVEEARLAKGRGVVVFTIGLGREIEADALRAMASRLGYFYVAPDAEDLTEIYRAIAVALPCPPETFWGKR